MDDRGAIASEREKNDRNLESIHLYLTKLDSISHEN